MPYSKKPLHLYFKATLLPIKGQPGMVVWLFLLCLDAVKKLTTCSDDDATPHERHCTFVKEIVGQHCHQLKLELSGLIVEKETYNPW